MHVLDVNPLKQHTFVGLAASDDHRAHNLETQEACSMAARSSSFQSLDKLDDQSCIYRSAVEVCCRCCRFCDVIDFSKARLDYDPGGPARRAFLESWPRDRSNPMYPPIRFSILASAAIIGQRARMQRLIRSEAQ